MMYCIDYPALFLVSIARTANSRIDNVNKSVAAAMMVGLI